MMEFTQDASLNQIVLPSFLLTMSLDLYAISLNQNKGQTIFQKHKQLVAVSNYYIVRFDISVFYRKRIWAVTLGQVYPQYHYFSSCL